MPITRHRFPLIISSAAKIHILILQVKIKQSHYRPEVSRGHPPHWLSSKGPNYQRAVLLISAGAIEGHFEGKTPREGRQMGSCPCTTMHRLTGHFQPRRNWPTSASSVLITHPIPWSWPLRTTTCSLGWKSNWMVAIFRPTRRPLLPRRPGWTDNFLNFFWLACIS